MEQRLRIVGVLMAALLQFSAVPADLGSVLFASQGRNVGRDTEPKTETESYYIIGAVRKPGRYDLIPDLTVEKAIVLAGGTKGGTIDEARLSATRLVPGKEQKAERRTTPLVLTEAVLARDIIDVSFQVKQTEKQK